MDPSSVAGWRVQNGTKGGGWSGLAAASKFFHNNFNLSNAVKAGARAGVPPTERKSKGRAQVTGKI